MSLSSLIRSFPWQRYSKKLAARIEKPRNGGFFASSDAVARGMILVTGDAGDVQSGNKVCFYWLVDGSDGIIVDAKFQVLGQSALIAAADSACDLIVSKNYDQASRVGSDLIDRELRSKNNVDAFPPETFPHLNLVVDAIDAAAEKCSEIPLAANYIAPPAPTDIGEIIEGGYPGFDLMPPQKQLAVVEAVLESDVRPYIALDGGGVSVLEIINKREVIIAYEGTCTSCFSAVGATLGYIKKVLNAKVHPDLEVIPNL